MSQCGHKPSNVSEKATKHLDILTYTHVGRVGGQWEVTRNKMSAIEAMEMAQRLKVRTATKPDWLAI